MRRAFLAGAIGATVLLTGCATAPHGTSTTAPAAPQANGPPNWLAQLAAASKAQNSTEAYRYLTQLVDHAPQELAEVDTQAVSWVYNERARSVSLDEIYASLNHLFDAYNKISPPREPESLWISLALMAADRGEIERTRSVTGHLKNPHYFVNVVTDKSFDPVTAAAPKAFNIENASARYIDDVRKQVASQPRSLRLRLQLIDALVTANQFDEALRLGDGIAAQVSATSAGIGAFDDSGEAFWIADARARALRGLGRHEEAIDVMRQASRPAGQGAANTPLTINLGSYLCASGRPQEAMQVMNTPIWVSPYGLMNVHVVRQWAALQMNDAATAAQELDFMRQHQGDNYRAYQSALVAAGQFREAVQLMTFRLSNKILRTDALMQVQRFNYGNMPPEERKRELAWREFTSRADVQAAVSAVGRIKYFSIGPTQGWD